jgi:TRAP-type C4-dicarboxylate transport system substrate-binding protein
MKCFKRICLFISVCLLIAFPMAASPASQNKPIILRYSTFFPSGHPHTVLSEQWCKEVEKRTNGRVQVRHYPGATLTSPPQTYSGIVKGVIDIGLCVLAYTTGKFPLTDGLYFPLGFPSGSVATKLVNEYYAKFKPAEFNEVKVMYLQASGPAILHTRKPVYKLEDMQGLKIRVGATPEFISNLGGVPVAMPMGDSYDAISSGVVDGIYAPYEALDGWKLGEVIKYSTENWGSSQCGVQMVAMNLEKWESLSEGDQKTIEMINKEWIEKQGKMWDDMDRAGKDFTLKRGNKVIELSPEEDARFAAAVNPIVEAYIKKMKEIGLPGEEVMNFYRDKLKIYRK